MRALAILVARAAFIVSRLAGKDGTSLPGMWATKVSPHILKIMAQDVRRGIILITGTNGKTSTTNLCQAYLEDAGYSVICNSGGANMYNGVVAAFLKQASLFKRCAFDYAVLEVDELYTPRIGKEIPIRTFVITNLFADQLDRCGSIDYVRDTLVSAIGHTPDDCLVVLNRDNRDSAIIADTTSRKTVTFGIEHSADLHATDVRQGEALSFRIDSPRDNIDATTNLRGLYNISNILAATVAATSEGITLEQCADTLMRYQTQPGRMERFEVAYKHVTLTMAKNPAGFNRSLESLSTGTDTDTYDVVIAVNNTIADGEDTAWYSQIDFENLDQESRFNYYLTGTQAPTMAKRLKQAGIIEKRVHTHPELDRALQAGLDGEGDQLFILANYSTVFPLRKRLIARMNSE